jgi:NH3-dependent NAD+ synthetase
MTVLEDLQNKPPSTELSDKAKYQTLRSFLDLMMSQIDYPMGACKQTDKICTLVRPDFLDSVRKALEITR